MQIHIKPKKYIKKHPQNQQYECKICFELTDAPMRCAGPCKTVFCQYCITYTKNVRDKCPLRCSQTFNAQPLPHLFLQYDCPFNRQQCKVQIKSRLQFLSHYESCKYVSEAYIQRIQKKKRYLCDNNHKLYFLNKFVYQQLFEEEAYQNVYRLKCVSCGDQGTCSSICFDCTTPQQKAVYCTDCRSIPCSTFSCPLGHILFGKNVNGYIGLKNSQICHLCGILPALVKERVYFDTLCGLVLCEVCHSNLPRQNQLIPLQHYLYNKQNQPYQRSLAAFKREQQMARQEMRREIMAQYENNSSSEQESSDENSDSSQRIRRFFRGQRIRHSSSDQSQQDSNHQRNRIQIPRALLEQLFARHNHEENASTGQELSQSHQRNSQSHPASERENLQEQDEFFSLDSEPEYREQQQFFLCQSWENESSENVSIIKPESKPKNDSQ